jgi:predicted enzyme related to lactoylglutathione lyase
MESPGFSMLSCGDALIALHIIEPDMPEGLTAHAGLCLQVDDLETAIADICKAGGRQRFEIREAEPHVPVRVVEVQDSEGNAFELRQEVEQYSN